MHQTDVFSRNSTREMRQRAWLHACTPTFTHYRPAAAAAAFNILSSFTSAIKSIKVWACLSRWWERFRETQIEDNSGPLSIQSSLLLMNKLNCIALKNGKLCSIFILRNDHATTRHKFGQINRTWASCWDRPHLLLLPFSSPAGRRSWGKI